MSRATALAAVITALLTAAVPLSAIADGAPDPANVKRAGREFDLGVDAFKGKQFEEAAQHFEAADEAVPGAKALRFAIRARSEAGQASRAATLAEQALERYPGDADLAQLARDTIQKSAPQLHKVKVSCASPCVLAVGTRAVPGVRATRWVVWLDPGKASINASFLGDTSGKPRAIDAVAGGSSDARFEPIEPSTLPPSSGAPAATSASAPTGGAATGSPAEPDPPKPAKGIHPAFFGVGAALTAAAGGVLVWSGIDTLQNPGPETVRLACAGKGPTCPEYQLGLENQLRTNILIGATAGAGAVTVLLAVFTRWSGADPVKKTGLVPSIAVLDRGAALGVAGAFE